MIDSQAAVNAAIDAMSADEIREAAAGLCAGLVWNEIVDLFFPIPIVIGHRAADDLRAMGVELASIVGSEMTFDPAPASPPTPRNEAFEAWRKRTAKVLEQAALRKQ